jgi:elongation factor P
MAQLEYNEIRVGKIIIWNDEPCEILDSHVARTQQRKPQNQVKMRSLKSGKAYNQSFHVSDGAEEADIEKRETKFLFTNKGEFWFADPKDAANRFKLEESLLGEKAKYLTPNGMVSALVWTNEDEEEEIIGVALPVKMTFEVKEAPPAIKGDTRTGGSKQVVLENGATVNCPLFVDVGDKIVVNTETGEYVERATK